jgi:hypothetical protein
MEPDKVYLNRTNVEKRDSNRHQGKGTKDCSSSTSVSRQAPSSTFTHSIQDRVLLINSDSVPVTIESIPDNIYTNVKIFEGLVREAACMMVFEAFLAGWGHLVALWNPVLCDQTRPKSTAGIESLDRNQGIKLSSYSETLLYGCSRLQEVLHPIAIQRFTASSRTAIPIFALSPCGNYFVF